MILKARFTILNPTQMNSNYPAYWLGDNLFKEDETDKVEASEEWRVSTISFMEDPIVSVNVVREKGFNRFFVTTMSTQGSRKLYEVKKDENVLIRDFGLGPVEEVQFRTAYFGDNISLLNPVGKFNMKVSLLSGEWSPIGKDEAYDWPEADKFRKRTGSGEEFISIDCKDGIRYVDGGSFSTIVYLDCDAGNGWASWDRSDNTTYFSTGKGVFSYDTYEKVFNQILYDPEIRNLDCFRNNEMDFIAYAKGRQLKVATNYNPKAWFENEYDFNHSFRRLLSEWSVYEPSDSIAFHTEPISIINHEVSFETEAEQMIVEEVGVFANGSYKDAKLYRIYKKYFYDKAPETLYDNVNIGYMIGYSGGSKMFLKNHMTNKNWLKNNSIAIADPGFAFNRSEEFSNKTEFFLDSETKFEQFVVKDTLMYKGVQLKKVATIPTYNAADFVLLDEGFYRSEKDDGSINLLLPDGTRIVYQYHFKDATTSLENVSLADYEIYTTRSCDGSRSDLASLHELDETKLNIIGAINEQSVYSFKDQNNPMLKSAFESYNEAMQAKGYTEDDSYETMDYDQFLSKPAIFFWKDPFGRFVRFIHDAALPPLNCEPIVYFYPESTQEINFELDEQIEVISSYPHYNDGWKMMVHPNGDFLDAKTGVSDHRVFWEGISGMLPPLKKGHVVARNEVDNFLSDRLKQLGLNKLEIAEFKEAWIDELTIDEYCFIGFYDQKTINQYAPINTQPQPETLIRVLMDYKPLDQFKEVEKPSQVITPQRKGFTVVEWGGLKR